MNKNNQFKKQIIRKFLKFESILIIMLILILVLVYQKTKTRYINDINKKAQNIIQKEKILIKYEFKSICSDLRFLSQLNELKSFATAPNQKDKIALEKELLSFLNFKGWYDQIRLLNLNGKEVVRVNLNNDNPSVVPEIKLQSKANRYYFIDAIKLTGNEIFISLLDLNKENGKIQLPLKPMIRFGVPIYDNNNKKKGILLFNYLGNRILNILKNSSNPENGEFYMVNSKGYWLVGPSSKIEWGFMYSNKKHISLAKLFPKLWKKLISKKNGQIISSAKILNFDTIYPRSSFEIKSNMQLQSRIKFSDHEISFWKIISYVSQKNLINKVLQSMSLTFVLVGFVFILMSFILWILSKTLIQKESIKFIKQQKDKEINNIIKHIDDGLFIINDNYQIGAGYSTALEKIFNIKNIKDMNFLDFLKQNLPKEKIKSISGYFSILFKKSMPEAMIAKINPLQKIELFNISKNHKDSKFLQFHFHRIFEKNEILNILVVVRDISNETKLNITIQENKLKTQKETELLYKILHISTETMSEFLEDTEIDLENINNILENDSDNKNYIEKLDEIFRYAHTIKGNASFLNFEFLEKTAHLFEEKIEILKNKNELKARDFLSLTIAFNELNSVIVSIKQLIKKISQFREDIDTNSNNSDLYLFNIEKLAKRLAKNEKKEIQLDLSMFENQKIPKIYRKLIKDVVIQFIRNSIYHGIETPDVRKSLKKNPIGKITLKTKFTNQILIEYKDDGKGLDLKKLREIAIASKKWNIAEIKKWSDSKVSELIFSPGISTSQKVSIGAGRGIGLDLIKKRIIELNGSINVKFKSGEFCHFVISFPKV